MENEIRNLLTQIRHKTGWSDYKIAEMLDVSQMTVNRYRNHDIEDCKIGFLNRVRMLAKKVNRLNKIKK